MSSTQAKSVYRWLFPIILLSIFLSGCAKQPPNDMNNICQIFKQYPSWQRHTKDVERRWLVPIPVQMAIVHQESHFDAYAKPARTKLLGIIPWKRPSSAYGYAQALNTTWKHYKNSDGGYWASRNNFYDAVDFIGWYANRAHRRAHIPRDNPYELYLAYHEGIGGYERRTYLQKPWLIQVARKVKARSCLYEEQLSKC